MRGGLELGRKLACSQRHRLSRWSQLTNLVVNDNALTGASLTGLMSLTSLRRLDLAGEPCQGEGLVAVGGAGGR